jgi:hypothetical protein
MLKAVPAVVVYYNGTSCGLVYTAARGAVWTISMSMPRIITGVVKLPTADDHVAGHEMRCRHLSMLTTTGNPSDCGYFKITLPTWLRHIICLP